MRNYCAGIIDNAKNRATTFAEINWRRVRFTLNYRVPYFLGRCAEINTAGFDVLAPGLSALFNQHTHDEESSFAGDLYRQGSYQQRARLAEVAEMAAQRWPGDFIEIGCLKGETTRELARVAAAHGRRVWAVDPWELGTQNCSGGEYETFLQNIDEYRQSVEIIRASSLDHKIIAQISGLELSFAYVDGLHTYYACLSDIRAVAHCNGIIAVDDVLSHDGVRKAFSRGAFVTKRTAIHHHLCREGYLLARSEGN